MFSSFNGSILINLKLKVNHSTNKNGELSSKYFECRSGDLIVHNFKLLTIISINLDQLDYQKPCDKSMTLAHELQRRSSYVYCCHGSAAPELHQKRSWAGEVEEGWLVLTCSSNQRGHCIQLLLAQFGWIRLSDAVAED